MMILSFFLSVACAPLKKPPATELLSMEPTKGLASWYGLEFHGKPTASGEIYNMYEYTCAHREYPFGTKLKITNLKNGKEVLCIVNDRGPLVPGRDIDLSFASAKKIDMIGSGLTEVLIQPVGRELSYVKHVKYSPLSGQLTIQVGSFREIENAIRLKQALSIKYSNVYISKIFVKGDTFFRVRVGKYMRYEEAYSVAKDLAQEGYSVYITNFEKGQIDEI